LSRPGLRDKIRDMQEGEIVQLVVFQQAKYIKIQKPGTIISFTGVRKEL